MDFSTTMSATLPTQGMSPVHVTFTPKSNNDMSFGVKKRRMEDNIDEVMKENKAYGLGRQPQSMPPVVCSTPRRFLAVPGNSGVFHTEEWRERQTPMYLPVAENLLINTAHIEQISFTAGSCFLADEAGNYCASQDGNIINLWRYDEKERKLYVSRSLLFTDEMVFHRIRGQLEEL